MMQVVDRRTSRPMIGGSLSHPHERFSKTFPGSFWKDYPYFLPCLVSAIYVLFALLITLIMFKEVRVLIYNVSMLHFTIEWFQTLPANKSRHSSLECCDTPTAHVNDKPLPLHKVLIYPVILSVANYVALSFLNIAVIALLPLFLAMPLDIGGLNLSPPAIGYIIGSFGTIDAIFQIFFFASIVRRLGERNVFIFSISTSIPMFLIFPVINFVARKWGQLSIGVWILLILLLLLLTIQDMAFGMTHMYEFNLIWWHYYQEPFFFSLPVRLLINEPSERQMEFLKQPFLSLEP